MHQQRQGGFILLVEDNPDDVELTERAFKSGDLALQHHEPRTG